MSAAAAAAKLLQSCPTLCDPISCLERWSFWTPREETGPPGKRLDHQGRDWTPREDPHWVKFLKQLFIHTHAHTHTHTALSFAWL